RAARCAAARPQLRIDRPARSRDLPVPAARPLGIDRAIARSGPARPPPRVRHASCARAELLRSVRRLHGPAHRLRGRRSRAGDGPLRLAAVGRERLEGRASTARLSAPADSLVRRSRRRAPPALSCLPRHARAQTALLPRSRSLDRAARGIPLRGLIVTGSVRYADGSVTATVFIVLLIGGIF